MDNEKFDIEQKIYGILKDYLKVNGADSSSPQAPLTGAPLFLTARQMVYLFFAVERAFGIRLAEEDVVQYRFNTVGGIAETIVAKCHAQAAG